MYDCLNFARKRHVLLYQDTFQHQTKSSLRCKRSCSKEELPNDFPQTGRAKVGSRDQSLDPTFARLVCGKSFGSSSFEQERLLRRLNQIHKFLLTTHHHSMSILMETICFPGTIANPRILGSSFSSSKKDIIKH